MVELEAIYENGVFRPLRAVSLPEHQRVHLIVESPSEAPIDPWVAELVAVQNRVREKYGVFPDSTTAIADDRQR
jgi:predicted DNA-binding antitoxin AbrB/MazE fold protein